MYSHNTANPLEIMGKALITLISIYLSFKLALSPNPWIFLDYVNLLFHEAGHLLTFFLGETISIFGGTLFQLGIPLGIMVYFLLKRSYFSAFFSLFWLGDSLVNVSVYIKDANDMALPLIVGGGIHDWNYLLTKFNLLDQANLLGNFTYAIGLLALFTGTALMAVNTINSALHHH